jgi:hypothetical protein
MGLRRADESAWNWSSLMEQPANARDQLLHWLSAGTAPVLPVVGIIPQV